MEQSKRIAKNNRYKTNLAKRSGITLAVHPIIDHISKKICRSHLTHEFITTRRHGSIVTKEVYTYKWSKAALAEKDMCIKMKETYTGSKTSVTPTITKENYREFYNKQKAESKVRFESLPYSPLHIKLVEIPLSLEAIKAKKDKLSKEHNYKINRLLNIIRKKKEALIAKRLKKKPFSIKVICKNENNELYDLQVIPMGGKLNVITDIASSMNKKLSTSLKNYHHLSVLNNSSNKVLLLFTNSHNEAA